MSCAVLSLNVEPRVCSCVHITRRQGYWHFWMNAKPRQFPHQMVCGGSSPSLRARVSLVWQRDHHLQVFTVIPVYFYLLLKEEPFVGTKVRVRMRGVTGPWAENSTCPLEVHVFICNEYDSPSLSFSFLPPSPNVFYFLCWPSDVVSDCNLPLPRH